MGMVIARMQRMVRKMSVFELLAVKRTIAQMRAADGYIAPELQLIESVILAQWEYIESNI